METTDQKIILSSMSNDLMLCMWRQMLGKNDNAPRDLTTQNMLRDELLRRNVIRFDKDLGKYVVVSK